MKKNLLMRSTVLATYYDFKIHAKSLYNPLNELIDKLYL